MAITRHQTAAAAAAAAVAAARGQKARDPGVHNNGGGDVREAVAGHLLVEQVAKARVELSPGWSLIGFALLILVTMIGRNDTLPTVTAGPSIPPAIIAGADVSGANTAVRPPAAELANIPSDLASSPLDAMIEEVNAQPAGSPISRALLGGLQLALGESVITQLNAYIDMGKRAHSVVVPDRIDPNVCAKVAALVNELTAMQYSHPTARADADVGSQVTLLTNLASTINAVAGVLGARTLPTLAMRQYVVATADIGSNSGSPGATEPLEVINNAMAAVRAVQDVGLYSEGLSEINMQTLKNPIRAVTAAITTLITDLAVLCYKKSSPPGDTASPWVSQTPPTTGASYSTTLFASQPNARRIRSPPRRSPARSVRRRRSRSPPADRRCR
jgi:hypothetical protein